jgi:hypothetical protein
VEAKIEDFVAGATDDANATPDSPVQEPAAEPASAPLPEPAPADTGAEEDTPSGDKKIELSDDDKPQAKKVGGERVIQPIDAAPKKDIDQLLAEEEAKESSPKINVVTSDDKPKDEPVDPNSIAL